MRSMRLKLKPPEPKESEVLYAVKQALRLFEIKGRVAWWSRMNTAKGRISRGSKGASQWIEFGFTGCPDILGQLDDGRVLAIEVKRPSGRLNPEQKAFLDKACAANACAFVARSADDVFRELA